MAESELPRPLRLTGRESCIGRGDIFFPDRTTPAGRARVAEAIELCQSCPQIEPCRELGDALRAVDGVWGGVDMFFRWGPEAWRARRRDRERAARSKMTMPDG